jgi:L-alanine-DL-glutamate epimerase-like enolase superfamily enzyme
VKITEIRAYRIELPLREGSYKWSGGNAVTALDSTVVAVETDSGIVGYGEICPLGPTYLPAYPAGARTGIATISPNLIGVDPRELSIVNQKMDQSLRGHPYVKSALDIACWDILGKASGLPLTTLLGGRFGSDFPLYRAISRDRPEAMAESVARFRGEGYRKFQLKVGETVETDVERIKTVREALEGGDVLVADANGGWTLHQAARVVDAVSDLDVYIEQPCNTYEQCLAVRRRTPRPFILDEVIDSMAILTRGISDQAMDVVNLKISRVGGLTRARQFRDLCVSSGVALTIEDSWGGDIVTAAVAHLAHSTPTEYLFSTTDFNSYVTVSFAENPPKSQGGRMSAPTLPGLGIKPKIDALGAPILVIR